MKPHPALPSRSSRLHLALAFALLTGTTVPGFAAAATPPPATPERTTASAAAATPPTTGARAARAANPDLIPQPPPAPTVVIYEVKDVDQGPVPTFQSPPRYPVELRQLRVSAEVPVEFFVQPDGSVTNVQAVPGSDARFNKAAEDAVAGWRFRPGMKDGKPVPVRIRVPIVFRIN